MCAYRACAEAQQIIEHLQAVDPANALAWLPELAAAEEQGDASQITQWVAKFGAAARPSIYWNSTTVMMVDALGEKDIPTELVYVSGILAAMNIPPLWVIANPCRLDQLQQTDRREACQAALASLANSDNFMMQALANSMQTRRQPEGSAERDHLVAQRRQMDYVMQASSFERFWHMRADCTARLEAMRKTDNELETMYAMLNYYHKPRERPADWQPPYPFTR